MSSPAAASLPPGSRLPAAIQLLWYAWQPVQFLERCRRRHGRCFTVRRPAYGPLVHVADSAMVPGVLLGDPHTYHVGEANRVLEPLFGPNSIFLLDEAAHLRLRRRLQPHFRGPAVAALEELVAKLTEREVESWPVGRPFPLLPRMRRLTLDVFLRGVLGIDDAATAQRLRTLFASVVRASKLAAVPFLRGGLGPWRPFDRFQQARDALDRAILELADGRRAELGRRPGRDLLSSLVSPDAGGGALSDAELRDHVVSLALAGHETTATALSWVFERLVRNPSVLERLLDELASGGEEYLEAVVKETLRARPVFPRGPTARLTAPAQVGGFLLPAGTLVTPCILLLHRDSQAFPDPDAFRPERFLDGHPEPYAWIPFGAGPHRCLGATMALAEMRVVVSTVLRRVRLAAPAGPAEAVRYTVTCRPSRGGRVVAAERWAPVGAAGAPPGPGI